MAVFKRGRKYWYEFEFMGQRVREPANTSNKELAQAVERNRRRAMEESAGGVKKIKPILFKKAARNWLGLNAQWAASTREINTLNGQHEERLDDLPEKGWSLVSTSRFSAHLHLRSW